MSREQSKQMLAAMLARIRAARTAQDLEPIDYELWEKDYGCDEMESEDYEELLQAYAQRGEELNGSWYKRKQRSDWTYDRLKAEIDNATSEADLERL
jgi:hypothetical protein